MDKVRFESLPEELIKHIAVISLDASTVINLSQTCQRFRAACYDSLIFKEILEQRQATHWDADSFDIASVSRLCGKEAGQWARFAVADQKAWAGVSEGSPPVYRGSYVDWLPELMVAKHPIAYRERFRILADEQDAPSICSLAISQLAQDPPEDLARHGRTLAQGYQAPHVASTSMYLRTLCHTIWTLRRFLSTRRAVRPYNNAPVMPYIDVPKMKELSLCTSDASFQHIVPAPYHISIDDRDGAWPRWYARKALESIVSISEGTWTGYYTHATTHLGMPNRVDPPMLDIKFIRSYEGSARLQRYGILVGPDGRIVAENGRDGVGTFVVEGALSQHDDRWSFHGYKSYHNMRTTWRWMLEMTPFGMVGYWTATDRPVEEYAQYGAVWLWKA